MIDHETELRGQLDRAAADVHAPPDLLATVERRIVVQRRQGALIRVAGALVAAVLAAGVALAVSGGGDDAEEVPVASDPTGTSAPATTLVPPDPPPLEQAGAWGTIATAPIPGRWQHVALDMDGEVLVWAGNGVEGSDGALERTDAAVYQTATDTWREVPDAPLYAGNVAATWTGEVVIAVSINSNDGASPYEAASFDPATDTWTPLAEPPTTLDQDGIPALAWTGSHAVLLNSVGGLEQTAEVALYDPATDTWTTGTTSPAGADFPTDPIWTGSEIVAVGSRPDDPTSIDATAVTAVILAYDPAADTWRELPWELGPARRWDPAAAWTGTHLFVGGGLDPAGMRSDAALVDLDTGTWTPLPDAPAPFLGLLHGASAVWTGSQVVLLSDEQGNLSGTPLAYEPATGGWSQGPALPGDPVPFGPAVWSADRIVVPAIGAADEYCCIPRPDGGLTYTP